MSGRLELDNPFWRFSLAVYAAPGVETECLALQDDVGIDVNMLLYCAWRGAEGELLSVPAVTALEESVRDWRRRVVEPLRAVRRYLKQLDGIDQSVLSDLRKEILCREIEAEQVKQAILFGRTRPAPTPSRACADAVRANLDLYLGGYRKDRAATLALSTCGARLRSAVRRCRAEPSPLHELR